MFAGRADARVQEANLTGCANADTVVFMQKGGLNFLYPLKETSERAKKSVPLGRAGQLREVGLLALYLVSDASDYMTGQTLVLDGGVGL